jgi:PEP-CTERM motif
VKKLRNKKPNERMIDMKYSLKTTLLGGLLSAVMLTPVLGQPFIAVDEYGNMTIGGALAAPGVIAVDPISGLPTLSYVLPFPVNPGDVLLIEPGPNTNQVSDVLRFVNNRLFFFSDASTNEPPEPGVLADGPLPPPNAALPVIVFTETGPEPGVNGLFGYVPGPGGIGGSTAAPGVTYDFISDGQVPEPSSVAVLGLGLAALVCRRRWRR